ncbi:MAG: PCRF domain-containing protein, partial [Chloroflexi bacterium]
MTCGRSWMTCGGRFDLARRESEIKKLEELSAGGAFWDDQQQAQKVLKQLAEHRSWVEAYRTTERGLGDLAALAEMAAADESAFADSELDEEFARTNRLFEDLELRAMLTGR